MHTASGHFFEIAPETPAHQALLMALGLARFQTTWEWPWGERWAELFSGGPPEHRLPAHFWHLCWAAGDPANPEHLERARRELERGDPPELVDALRRWMVVPVHYGEADGSAAAAG